MKIMLAMPTRSGQMSIETAKSLFNDVVAMERKGWSVTFLDEVGNTDLSKARLLMALIFHNSDYDRLVYIDDDVCWQPGGLVRLIDRDKDFVGAAYPARKDELIWPVRWLDPGSAIKAEDGLIDMGHLPGGFWVLSKACIGLMHTHWGRDMFNRLPVPDGALYPEDISFCMRWRQVGGQVWMDPEIEMGHVGRKVWRAKIGDWLRNR